jgi:hypothetical protein
VVVVALPFAVIKEDGPRVRPYLLTCAAPAGIFFPAYLSAGGRASGYGTLMMITVAFLLSFSLVLVGAVLLVGSRRRPELRRNLGIGMLLAALPLILVYLSEYLRHE